MLFLCLVNKTQYCNSKARVPDCLSGCCEFESRQYCKYGKITVVVYLPWTQEVAGSNPAFHT